MTKITFVRHGNTDWNNEKRAQGNSNNPINETGRKEAQHLATCLADSPVEWDAIISSDLLRARETAEIITRKLNRNITFFDQRLREIDRGQIRGTIEAERITKWGPDWRNLDLGMESKEALRQRGVNFVTDMVNKYVDKHLLVISHGLLIRETLKELLEDEEVTETLKNTSISTIERQTTTWFCSLYNCTTHLEGVRL